MVHKKDHAFYRYLTYQNYLDAVARLIDGLYPSDEDLVRTLAGRRGFQVFARQAHTNLEDLAMVLRHGWYTELLMRTSAECPGVFPYAVPWSMVHAYYAINRAMQAYFMISRDEVPTNHNGSLRTMSTELRSANGPFPVPWCCILGGDPEITTVTLMHTPVDIIVTLTNPLEAPDDPWQHFGLLLRTTRKRQLEEWIQAWKKSRRKKRIMKHERQELIDRMLPTTLFDALYRMRRRSNYQDTDSFIFSHITGEDALVLHNALCTLVHASLLTFECLIARVTPSGWFDEVVAEFVAASGGPAYQTVGARRAATHKVLG